MAESSLLDGGVLRAEQWAELHRDAYAQEKRISILRYEQEALAKFKKSYIKIRTDNVVLDHSTAIELTKMIHSEADTLTFKDTQ